jgi:hypothetical protein
MESLSNDMDDLFRKAGDLYPLKTTGSDWDGVLGKLREEGILPDGNSKRQLLIINLPSVTDEQLVNSPAAQTFGRCVLLI